MENIQATLMPSLDYKKKIKTISILLFAVNFMDIVYLEPTAFFWENFAYIMGFGLGCLHAYKLYQGAKWAEIFVYVFTIIFALGFLYPEKQTWHQQIVSVVQSVLLFSTMFFLLINRQETRLYFGKPPRTIWFVSIISISVIFVVVAVGVSFMEKMIHQQTEEIRPLLTREGITPKKGDESCLNIAKLNDVQTDELDPFCNCFLFNFEKIVTSKNDFRKSFWRNNPLQIITQSQAIAILCKENSEMTSAE